MLLDGGGINPPPPPVGAPRAGGIPSMDITTQTVQVYEPLYVSFHYTRIMEEDPCRGVVQMLCVSAAIMYVLVLWSPFKIKAHPTAVTLLPKTS